MEFKGLFIRYMVFNLSIGGMLLAFGVPVIVSLGCYILTCLFYISNPKWVE